MTQIQNYINGEFLPSASGKRLENLDPASMEGIGSLPSSDSSDVDRAVNAAQMAQEKWARLSLEDRSRWLRKVACAISEKSEELARAESLDTGKPISLSRSVDIPRAIRNFEFFADALTQFPSEFHSDGSVLNYTLRQPLGTVGCISPWNLPLYLLTWKIAPAIAMGNTLVAKPSEVTPLTAFKLCEILDQIQFPAGVINIVHGTGPSAGSALVNHPLIRAISFTGSTQTGRTIATDAARRFAKSSLELGGKNATIIFDDADILRAIPDVIRSAFTNQGQVCLCGSRILIARSLYPKVRDALVSAIEELKIGDPQDPMTQQGALVSEAHAQKVYGSLEIAKKEGARVLTGGNRLVVRGRCEKGNFLPPTLLEGLPSDCQTNQEEIFGPIATLIPFDSDSEALQIANSTRYGLAASLWTKNVDRAHGIAAKLATGMVWINCWNIRDLRIPFGGMKESGVGREGGLEALRFFTEPRNICVRMQEEIE